MAQANKMPSRSNYMVGIAVTFAALFWTGGNSQSSPGSQPQCVFRADNPTPSPGTKLTITCKCDTPTPDQYFIFSSSGRMSFDQPLVFDATTADSGRYTCWNKYLPGNELPDGRYYNTIYTEIIVTDTVFSVGCDSRMYKYFDSEMTSWEEAKSLCEAQGMNIVVPSDQVDVQAISAKLPEGFGDFWTGYKKEYEDDPWLDATCMDDYDYFDVALWKDVAGMGGDCVSVSDGQTKAVPCSQQNKVVCQKAGCNRLGRVSFGAVGYHVMREGKTQEQAKTYCRGIGMNLVSFDDTVELKYAQSLSSKVGISDSETFWTGWKKSGDKYLDSCNVTISDDIHHNAYNADGSPSSDPKECVVLSNRTVSPASCTDCHKFICEEKVKHMVVGCDRTPYLYSGTKMSWDDAYNFCLSHVMTLVVPGDMQEISDLMPTIQGSCGEADYWTGVSRLDPWSPWMDQVCSRPALWQAVENEEETMCVAVEGGTRVGRDCRDKKNVVCQYAYCDVLKTIHFDSKTYHVIQRPRPRDKAMKYCETIGGSLISYDSPQEMEGVCRHLVDDGLSHLFFWSSHAAYDGQSFVDACGSPLHFGVENLFFNNTGYERATTRLCAAMKEDALITRECNECHQFICEMPGCGTGKRR